MTPVPILALTLGAGITLVKLTLGSPTPLASFDLAAPQPVPGVWALLTRDCAAPTGLDLAAWPACAQPVGFSVSEASLLQRPEGGNIAAKTGKLFSVGSVAYTMVSAPMEAGGVLAQVEAPGLTGKSYVYLVLKPGGLDTGGRFSDATVFPVACPTATIEGVARQGERCRAGSLAAVRAAAVGAMAPSAYDYTMRLVTAADASEAAPSTAPPTTVVVSRRGTPATVAAPTSH